METYSAILSVRQSCRQQHNSIESCCPHDSKKLCAHWETTVCPPLNSCAPAVRTPLFGHFDDRFARKLLLIPPLSCSHSTVFMLWKRPNDHFIPPHLTYQNIGIAVQEHYNEIWQILPFCSQLAEFQTVRSGTFLANPPRNIPETSHNPPRNRKNKSTPHLTSLGPFWEDYGRF